MINNLTAFIKRHEGFRATPYKCSGGRWTIGWGHTRTASPSMKAISMAEADRLLSEDIAIAQEGIKKLVKIALNNNQLDALTSFVFNIGEKEFSTSTLLELLNNEDYKGAATQFKRWIYSGGKKTEGLITRRKEERKLFERPVK